LTGLPNRRLLGDRLSQALAAAKRDGMKAALLYLDLDGFKSINDMLGHAAGDLVLVETARRLRSRVRESDTVARMGGDEFTLLLTRISDRDHLEVLANGILQSLGKPFQPGDRTVAVTASIGIGVFPDDSPDTASLLEHADLAMYAVKHHGKNAIRFYTSELADGKPARPVSETIEAVN
jgi:diguanylate cyclase (GGDEF)-like protein